MSTSYTENVSIKYTTKTAIIGGGPGGLYTAMRLNEKKENCLAEDLMIFDANCYIGGRVRTLPIEKLPFTAEIGAMRYIPDRQLIINSVIDKLRLNEGERNLHLSPTSEYYLRKQHILPRVNEDTGEMQSRDQKSINRFTQTVFNLTPLEKSFQPNELVLLAILKAFEQMSFIQSDISGKLIHIHHDVNDKLEQIKDVFKVSDEEINEETKKGRNNPEAKAKAKKIREFISNEFKFDFFKYEQWDLIRNYAKYKSKNLYDTCLYEILLNELSQEAVILSQDAIGYNTIFASANAAGHIPWFLNDFQISDYKTIKNGMSRLTDEMHKTITNTFKENEKWYFKNHRLISVIKEKNGKFILKLIHQSETVFVECEKIIFSISKGALERIHFPTPNDNESFRLNEYFSENNTLLSDVVQCVTAYPLMKGFVFYEKDWFWSGLDEIKRGYLKDRGVRHKTINIEDSKLCTTKTITDTPICQIFFHGEGGVLRRTDNLEQKHIDGTKGMIMVYGDSGKAVLWSSLSGPHKENLNYTKGVFEELYASEGLEETKKLHNASLSFVDVIIKSLQLVFEGERFDNFNAQKNEAVKKQIAQPTAVFMQDWSEAPFYGGWHAWRTYNKPWQIRHEIQKPFVDNNIFICGEAFSSDQGWIEGAFRTSEKLLQKYFGLKTPDWFLTDTLKKTSHCSEKRDNREKDKTEKEIITEDYLNW